MERRLIIAVILSIAMMFLFQQLMPAKNKPNIEMPKTASEPARDTISDYTREEIIPEGKTINT